MPIYVRNGIFQFPEDDYIRIGDIDENIVSIRIDKFIKHTNPYTIEECFNMYNINLDDDKISYIINNFPEYIKFLKKENT